MRSIVLLLIVLVACSNAADPGAPDAAPVRVDSGPPDRSFAGLVINEVAAAGDPEDWFELFNGSAAAMDLSGASYSDEPDLDPAKAVFPDGTVVAAGSYLLKTVSDGDPGFKLGADEALGLFAPDRSLIDLVDWDTGQSPAGASFGRIPDGTGAFKTLATPTPGAANVDGAPLCGNGAVDDPEVCDGAQLGGRSCLDEGFASGVLACAAGCDAFDTAGCIAAMARVVLNEASSDGDDLIELHNAGDAVADLSGWSVIDSDATNTPYVFPAGTMLAAGDYRVLTKGTEHSFGLGATDGLTLRDGAGAAVDGTAWSSGAARPSWCRVPDGAGAFASCAAASFGASNGP